MTEMQRMNRALYISLMEKIAASDFVCSSSGHVLNMSGASAFGIAITKKMVILFGTPVTFYTYISHSNHHLNLSLRPRESF